MGFYFGEGLAVEVFAREHAGGDYLQLISDADGEVWFAVDAAPTHTSMGPCSNEHLAEVAREVLDRPRDGTDWQLKDLREGLSLVYWEANGGAAGAARAGVASPALYLLRFDNGLFLGSSARPLLQLSFGLTPAVDLLQGVLQGEPLPRGRTALDRLWRLEANTAVRLLAPGRDWVALPRPAPQPSTDPIGGARQVLLRDGGESSAVAILAVGSPSVDVALCLAARGMGKATVVEPVLQGNEPLIEALATELGLGYVCQEFSPEAAFEEWARIIPFLDEPIASLRGLAHLLGVRTAQGAPLYASSMGLPSRSEGEIGGGLGHRLRSFFAHRREEGSAADPGANVAPTGSRAAFAVLQGLVRHEGLRFSFPMTDASLGFGGFALDDIREILTAAGLSKDVTRLPVNRGGEGLATLVREVVMPALLDQLDDGPRWLHQGAVGEALGKPERAVKESPVGLLFLYTLLAWLRSVGGEE